jgi:hypothetical protein
LTLSSTLDPSLNPIPSFEPYRTPACGLGNHLAVTCSAHVFPGFQLHWICIWMPFIMSPPSCPFALTLARPSPPAPCPPCA